jgi:hypothetical protein
MSTTTLPRAVQKQKDELDQRIAEATGAAEEPKPVEAAESEPAPVEPPAEDPNSQTWEQRYKVLQGMHKKEIGDLRQEFEYWKTTNSQPALVDSVPPQPQLAPDPEPFVTQEDIDAWGEDTIELQTRIAKGVAQEQMAPMLQHQQEIQSHNFNAVLTSLAPSWEQLNHDPGFLQWLAEPIPYSGGLIRHDFLLAAHKRQDAATVAQVFNDFTGNPAPAPEPEPEGLGVPGNQPSHEPPQLIPPMDLGTQIVPPQVQATPSVAGQQGRTYTSTEVRDHFTEVSRKLNKGVLPHSLAERDTEINRAIREDRVVPG